MVDLGTTPLANSYVRPQDILRGEPVYPLRVRVCEACWLAQLDEIVDATSIFASDYAYFSSYSDSWLAHAHAYANGMIDRLGLHAGSQVVEVASNDGYLLKNFVARHIPALGIEPAANAATVAIEAGVPTRIAFFNAQTARSLVAEGISADLMVANNVLAHVPALNDFVAGFRILLKADGIATFEFPHLLRLMEEAQFDTIYHEHYSYFSLLSVERLFERHGLTIFDVHELPTHGGSLRVFVQRADGPHRRTDAPDRVREKEVDAGLATREAYLQFGNKVGKVRRDLVQFLTAAKTSGKTVMAYGAPAKGNTLLNYCGVSADLVTATVDRNPHKQNCYLPGTQIPVLPPDRLAEMRPDYVLILPWNLRDEIMRQWSGIGAWGGQFVIAIPELLTFAPSLGFGA